MDHYAFIDTLAPGGVVLVAPPFPSSKRQGAAFVSAPALGVKLISSKRHVQLARNKPCSAICQRLLTPTLRAHVIFQQKRDSENRRLAITRAESGKSPILSASQKMTLGKPTGYACGVLRRERDKSKTSHPSHAMESTAPRPETASNIDFSSSNL